jgi:hypothetical protein
MTGGAGAFGAYLLDGDGDADPALTTIGGTTGYDAYPTEFRIDGFAMGELGRDPALPEWVAIDLEDGGDGPPRAILVDDVRIQGDPAELAGWDEQVFEGFAADFVPRTVLIADLHAGVAGNEAWVIGADGRLVCLRRNQATLSLTACD